MITVCLWDWNNRYSVQHIAIMRDMLNEKLSLPHEIVCITDRANKMPAGIRTFDVRHTIGPRDHNCQRRMWLYKGQPKKGEPWPGDLGSRLLQLDLDVVLTDSIDPIVDRPDPFAIWKSDSTIRANRWHGWAYNATVMLLDAGARRDVYDRWHADRPRICQEADRDGWDVKTCSDQAIACYLMKDNPPAVWTQEDGIYAYRVIAGPDGMKDKGLPEGCRIVSFHGRRGNRHPGDKVLQQRSPWILSHWKAA